jgi:sarcosine oxidase
VAAGGFSIRPGLLPRALDLTVKARTVLLAQVDAEDGLRYAGMPSVICSGTGLADSFYILVHPHRTPCASWFPVRSGRDASTHLRPQAER